MSTLFETIQSALSTGPRSTEEVVTACRRTGAPWRAETVELFLRLASDLTERDGLWQRICHDKPGRILAALQTAFAGGQTYLPIAGLSRYLDSGDAITVEEIAAVCEQTGQFRLQGRLILRVQSSL